jgi:hypothetical protein
VIFVVIEWMTVLRRYAAREIFVEVSGRTTEKGADCSRVDACAAPEFPAKNLAVFVTGPPAAPLQ